MPYIRTKYEIVKCETITDVITKVTFKDNFIKASDSILELCDCFVEVGLGNPMIVTWDYVLHDDDRRNFDVYGAILTAKGIIYVAKMNEKGEFELL